MYLKPSFNASAFLKAAKTCSGQVICETAEGDKLDLKSVLCMYLFAAASTQKEIMSTSQIVCEKAEDYEILAPWLQMTSESL